MLTILRRVQFFAGIDAVRFDALFRHKGGHACTPDIPAVRIRLHAFFVKRMDADVFLILKRLQQPAQAIADGRLLRHGAVFKQLTIARLIVAHNNMQFVDLAAGALNQINMPGVQRIELAEDHADPLLTTRKGQSQKAVQRFQLLRAGAFNFGVEQLAQIALRHAAGVRYLL